MSDLQQRMALIAERYYRECEGAFHPGDLAEVLVSELGLRQEWTANVPLPPSRWDRTRMPSTRWKPDVAEGEWVESRYVTEWVPDA